LKKGSILKGGLEKKFAIREKKNKTTKENGSLRRTESEKITEPFKHLGRGDPKRRGLQEK